MKTINEIIENIEIEFSIDNYEENGVLCGYELNTYTDAGVNEIIFLDFRDENKDPLNPNDFIAEFESYMRDYTIDDRIESNRQDKRYREDFTLKQSLKDFEKWEKSILKLIENLKK